MIQNQHSMIFSPYMDIYDLVVPKDNLLRNINDLVDLSFVYEEHKDKYCHVNGRNAIDPIRMLKYLFLKTVFDLSDVDVVERSKYDMSFIFFLNMAPEEPVIESSSLTKFRKLRLEDVNLLNILVNKTIEAGMEIETVIGDAAYSEKENIEYNTPKRYLLLRY